MFVLLNLFKCFFLEVLMIDLTFMIKLNSGSRHIKNLFFTSKSQYSILSNDKTFQFFLYTFLLSTVLFLYSTVATTATAKTKRNTVNKEILKNKKNARIEERYTFNLKKIFIQTKRIFSHKKEVCFTCTKKSHGKQPRQILTEKSHGKFPRQKATKVAETKILSADNYCKCRQRSANNFTFNTYIKNILCFMF